MISSDCNSLILISVFSFFNLFRNLSPFSPLFSNLFPQKNIANNIKTIIAQRRLPAFDSGRHARLTYRPASGRPTAGRQVGLDRGRRPGGRRNGGFGGQRPPTENLNDFHNDLSTGSVGEGGRRKKIQKILLQQQHQQPTDDDYVEFPLNTITILL